MAIKKPNERTLRHLEAEATRRGLTLAEVFQEAANLWLSRREDAPVLTETERNNEYESNEAEYVRQFKG